ncbi:Uu.00g088910.m01.CDS01 [Anthostomella pinea]|uniref:Uu.00g088910.m01.CDS01 n=1 Tax=Anthostomella pinea TaxID=933095 RepID=A0AAI8VNT0_9PEZI|nr:Uu.00g088910.m01.CDS01 [Anthostomella pinea]
MRLIDTTTLEVKEFIGEPSDPDFPRYAILSHTWGQEEVSFHDIQNLELARQKQGFAKIAKCCEKALEEGLRWAWVDTCCIDKTSSAELSEAINSMFKWYEAATICYAFLSDFDPGPWVEWTTSNWFRRGWTLQELIAPYEVVFYFRTWKEIGSKRHFSEQLARTTRISQGILLHQEAMQEIPVATRMLWAKGRNTTRREDKAYCLFGILDVNMPLLYGEGGKAFSRLHEMILKSTDDDTLFLGSLTGDDQSSLDSRHLFDVPSIMITPEDVGTDVVYASYSAERSPKNPEIRTGTLSTPLSGAGEPPEIAYKEFRHGPVVEVSLRVPVTGGFADMVVSIHRGSDDAGVVTFSPMVRFRAFSSSGSARDGGSTTDVSPPTIDEDHKREGVS